MKTQIDHCVLRFGSPLTDYTTHLQIQISRWELIYFFQLYWRKKHSIEFWTLSTTTHAECYGLPTILVWTGAMATVSIEFSVFLDPRYRILAELSGQTRFDAIGRMSGIWAFCIEKSQSVLSVFMIDAMAEIKGYAGWLIEADLADAQEDGLVRIKGTEGRIEWLAEARKRQKAATQAAKVKRLERKDPKSEPTSDPKLDPISAPGLESSSASISASDLKKKTLADPSDTTRLWDFYSNGIKEKGLEAVHDGAKTNTLCQRLVKSHGLEKAKSLVKTFLDDRDAFVSDKAWSLGLLVTQQQKYLARIHCVRPKGILTFGGE